MLPLSLGMAWLLLAPLCLWLLIRGSNTERAGAIVTLVLLEAGTIAMNALLHPAVPVRSAAAHTLPAPPAGSAPAPIPASCDERAEIPRAAEVKAGGELLLSWPAVPRECDRAEVRLLARDGKLLIWLHPTRRTGEHETRQGVLTLPVRVKDGTASLKVPLHGKARHVPVDGRSGRPIPEPAV
ncbi:hypothetical protein HD597_008345 [Nonomuraea thailandensis]|uniref:Uncharacterized protein n=1 Tax=Nonomuraea thailandensis TaxID=1188745 RepID=A0A9X2GP73_9ACTN|nr:hypothetical protein [Nonomuraea thailandensis]MCP2361325.1 hypothetical protein [Nonomuraea thailandensis]